MNTISSGSGAGSARVIDDGVCACLNLDPVMWFKSRGFIRLLVGVVIVTLITLLLWRHEQQEYAGELRVFFRQLDLDSDGALTLQEWMAYYGSHTHAWAQCSGRIFQLADCDGD